MNFIERRFTRKYYLNQTYRKSSHNIGKIKSLDRKVKVEASMQIAATGAQIKLPGTFMTLMLFVSHVTFEASRSRGLTMAMQVNPFPLNKGEGAANH